MTVTVSKPQFNLRSELAALKKKTGLKGEEILRASSIEDAYSALGNNKNKIYNGSFDVWQRGTSFIGDSIYTADRWRIGTYANNDSYVSRQVITGLSGVGQYCLRYGRTSGSTFAGQKHLVQPLETADSIGFSGKWMTVSCYVRGSSTCTGIGQDVLVGITWNNYAADTYMDYNYFAQGGINSSNYTSKKLTTNWQRITYSMKMPDIGSMTQIGVYLTWNATATAADANDYVEVAGFQLEEGPVATPFDRRPYQQELSLCQRYYVRMGPYGVGCTLSTNLNVITATSARCSFQMPVPMRTYITALEQSGTMGDYQIVVGGGAVSLTAVPAYYSTGSNLIAQVDFTVASGLTAGQSGYARTSSTSGAGYLGWSAEL